jgi:phosphonate transport system substrate-binding protein
MAPVLVARDGGMTPTREFVFALAPTLGDSHSGGDRAEALRRYLKTALERPVRMIVPANYDATLEALRRGEADAAMVGDYVSRRGKRIGGVEELVAPVGADEEAQTYRSVIVTRNDTDIRDMPGLTGRCLGMVDGQSTSGYLVPRAMLREAGIDPDRDLHPTLYPRHRDVIEAVLRGEIEAGAMHENSLKPPSPDLGPEYARLRVLARSRPIPNGPLIVRSTLDAETRTLISRAMLRIHEADPLAAQVMLRQGFRFTMATSRANPTLKSIASLAGVSYATVSRVINESGYVAPATATRVRAIIDELGYAPNGHARVLHGRQFPLVGLLVDSAEHLLTPALVEKIAVLQAGFEQAGIPFVLCPVGASFEESPLSGMARDGRLGALIVHQYEATDPAIAALARRGYPILALGHPGTAHPSLIPTTLDTVVADILGLFKANRK